MGVISLQDYLNDLLILGNMCLNHCEYEAAMTYWPWKLYTQVMQTTLSEKGNFEQAKNYHTHALDIHLKQLGPEHVYVAASYNNLGTVYSDLGNCRKQKKTMHVHQTFTWDSSDLNM